MSPIFTKKEWATLAIALHLTVREVAVATRLLLGETWKEIADLLDISPETVRFHLRNLFRKFQVRGGLGFVLRIARMRADIVAGILPA